MLQKTNTAKRTPITILIQPGKSLKKALANPTAHMQAFTCPTWENEALYANCLEGANSIVNDPTLADWCPDGEHGEGHAGLAHPMIRKLKERWKDRPRDWDKRFGGKPQGELEPVADGEEAPF